MTFQPGESGNPEGRPKGVIDRRAIYRDMIEPYKGNLIKKALDMALAGNEAMLKLILDRLLPAKPKADPINIGPLEGSLSNQCEQIFTAVYSGKITIDECHSLIQSLAGFARVLEITELQRIIFEILEK